MFPFNPLFPYPFPFLFGFSMPPMQFGNNDLSQQSASSGNSTTKTQPATAAAAAETSSHSAATKVSELTTQKYSEQEVQGLVEFLASNNLQPVPSRSSIAHLQPADQAEFMDQEASAHAQSLSSLHHLSRTRNPAFLQQRYQDCELRSSHNHSHRSSHRHQVDRGSTREIASSSNYQPIRSHKKESNSPQSWLKTIANAHTQGAYKRFINEFMAFSHWKTAHDFIKNIGELNTVLRAWRNALEENVESKNIDKYVGDRVSGVKMYYQYLVTAGRIKHNPVPAMKELFED